MSGWISGISQHNFTSVMMGRKAHYDRRWLCPWEACQHILRLCPCDGWRIERDGEGVEVSHLLFGELTSSSESKCWAPIVPWQRFDARKRRRVLEHRPRDKPFSAQVGERNAADGLCIPKT
jgi:hypothetical protein